MKLFLLEAYPEYRYYDSLLASESCSAILSNFLSESDVGNCYVGYMCFGNDLVFGLVLGSSWRI